MLGIMATNLSQSAAATITSADEMTATMDTYRELGPDYADAVVESFVSRLGDQIDDRVAEAFDEQLTERMRQPGPLRTAATWDHRAALVVLATVLLGTLATILASGIAVVALAWTGLAVIDVAYLSRPYRPAIPAGHAES
jgi:hypothetical protein